MFITLYILFPLGVVLTCICLVLYLVHQMELRVMFLNHRFAPFYTHNGRRVAVPVQIALPWCEAIEVLEKQQQLALVTLESSEEDDDVLVEDGALDSFSEEVDQPLVVDPIAFSLPSASPDQSLVVEESGVGLDSSGRQVSYSDWFQK